MCQAVTLLRSGQSGIAALDRVIDDPGSSAKVIAAAEAILDPLKPILSAYGGTHVSSDPVEGAVLAAAQDLFEAAGFFERQELPGASAPPSGLGSREWARGELRRASHEVDQAAALLSTLPNPCPTSH